MLVLSGCFVIPITPSPKMPVVMTSVTLSGIKAVSQSANRITVRVEQRRGVISVNPLQSLFLDLPPNGEKELRIPGLQPGDYIFLFHDGYGYQSFRVPE